MRYPLEFKQNVVRSLIESGDNTALICKKFGIQSATLYQWKKKYGIIDAMNDKKNTLASLWPLEKKLSVLIATSNLTEDEFGKYLRENGLYSSDLAEFKVAISNALSGKATKVVQNELSDLKKEKKKLDKNILRKDKALAEMAARVVLLKKSHEIWGDPEDEN